MKSPKSGSAPKNLKVWRFHEQISFLQPFIKDRPRITNESMTSEDPQHSQHQDSEKVPTDSDNEEPVGVMEETRPPVPPKIKRPQV
jgi:hypothetical protein